MTRKRWSELSHRQQAAIVAAAMVQEALAAFVNLVGPLAYFTVGRPRG